MNNCMHRISIRTQAAIVFLGMATLLLGIVIIISWNASALWRATDTLVLSEVPTMRAAAQLQQSLNEIHQSFDSIGRLRNLADAEQVRLSEARFRHGAASYRLFSQAMQFGSETRAFKTADQGLLYQAWLRRGYQDQFQLRPVSWSVREPLTRVEQNFRNLVRNGETYFSTTRQVLRLRSQGNLTEANTVEEKIAPLYEQLDDDAITLIAAVQLALNENDKMIKRASDTMSSTDAPIRYGIPVGASVMIILLIIAMIVVERLLVRPIIELTAAARAISAGDFSATVPTHRPDEIGTLAQALNEMTRKLGASQAELEHQVEEKTQRLSEKVTEADQQKRAILNIIEDLEESKLNLEQKEQFLQKANRAIALEIENTKKFELAVNASTDAIVICEPNGRLVHANTAWESLTGISFVTDDTLMMDCNIRQRSPKEALEKLHQAIVSGLEFHSDEFIGERKNGSQYCVELSVYPILQKGTVRFLVGMQRDVTLRKREDAAKTDFVSLASHQLRTPLTALAWIFGMFQKGKVGTFTPAQSELIHDAASCVRTMSETVETMLMLSRLEAGKILPQVTTVNLDQTWKEVWELQSQACSQKNITCTCDCTVPNTFNTDARLLKEVLGNLLSNAIKYTPTNGHISTQIYQTDKTVVLSIADSGYGIPSHQQDRIFSKFFRADNVGKMHTEGTGLGLYLVRTLAELLGGRIMFCSTEDQGSTFTIILPRQ